MSNEWIDDLDPAAQAMLLWDVIVGSRGKWVAAWAEERTPDGRGAGNSWNPQPFIEARNTLAHEIQRNLVRWADAESLPRFQAVLGVLLDLQEPELRNGLSWTAGRFTFTLTRED
jgi:hypothetical protein